ncbi:Protein CBG18070 [Caenorhabditis briggsae]|uniref:Protein CBG18070 n=1 Tax=Caenorhabditis briggsae TaxID=6238 RepID=A8XSY8_CAEBR|nr:Protein CBG18070 [Caenorhabditis briggsae]CAP35591.2 Protein CBG18070 [Caenorhabditis briggsae]
MESNSNESGSHTSKSEKTAAPEVCKKWAELVFRVYERMIHSSEVSFFISAPQVISCLGFILGVCKHNTDGLVLELQGGNEKHDVDFLVDHTMKFAHKWSGELRTLLTPGHYHRARRVYAHPKFVHPHTENTFQYHRFFRVEEKIFEGPDEVLSWVARILKTNIPFSHRILNTWAWEQSSIDRMKQQRTVDDISTKVRAKKKKSEEGVLPKKASLLPMIPPNNPSVRSKKAVSEEDKKSPILVWMSHAVVEVPDEFFDGEKVYTWNDKEYLKIHGSPAERIRVRRGNFDFNTLMIPTQNRQLVMLIFYDYDSKLCSLEAMRLFVTNYFDTKGPSIVYKKQETAAANLHSVFVLGGFGDLAIADAVPSATGDPQKISHLQHYGLLSFRNSPRQTAPKQVQTGSLLRRKGWKSEIRRKQEEEKARTTLLELNAEQAETISYPICVVLWDKNRQFPAYMGQVTGKMTDQESEEAKQAEEKKKQKNKWLFC